MQLDIENCSFDYSHDLEGFCLINCVLQILNYSGIKNPYKFLDASLELRKNPLVSQDVHFKQNEWIKTVRKNIIQNHSPSSYEEIWEKNKAMIKEGSPIIVSVDMYMLPYAFNFHMTHGNHAAILTGYTDDGKNARLVDWFEWKFKGILESENYRMARTSLCQKDNGLYSGTPIENKWTELSMNGWSYDEYESLRDTLDKTLANYYGIGKDDNNTMYGPDVLRDIYNKIFDGNTDLQMKLPMIHEFRNLCFRLTSYIKLFHYYISQSLIIFENPLLDELENELTKSIKIWDVILRTMLKCLYNMNEISYSTVSMNLTNAIKLEEKRVDLIVRIRDTL